MPTQMGANKGGYAYPRFPFAFPVTDLTATATLTPGQCGVIAVTGGAAVTLTFPSPTGNRGLWYLVINKADYDLTLTAPTADTLVTDGDAAADSQAFSTTSHKIGGAALWLCDGTNWMALNVSDCADTIATA